MISQPMPGRRGKSTLPGLRVNSHGKLQIGTYISHKIPTGLTAESAIKIEESDRDSDMDDATPPNQVSLIIGIPPPPPPPSSN